MTAATQFLREEFFTLTLLGTLGRSGLWKQEVPELERKQLHRSLQRRLEILAAHYISLIPEADHLTNIHSLADGLSAEFGVHFRDGRFRIGLAQKALNLYLKYLWCADLAARPPHCPVDRLVQESAKFRNIQPWTDIDSMDDYILIIDRLRAVAGERSLAEWELEMWSLQKAKVNRPRKVR